MIGHDAVRMQLELGLPPVLLLLGPPSVGKSTLARHLTEHHKLHTTRWNRTLSAADARTVVQQAQVMRGKSAVIFSLDGATETAQNILLKVLEEPPPHVTFIMLATRNPLPTIISRSQVHRLGLLSPEQVASILVDSCGMEQGDAIRLAKRSRGGVREALQMASESDGNRVRSVVAAALRAGQDGGGATLELALRSWSAEHTAVLRRWAEEASSGRWTWFTPDFAPAVTASHARAVLETLSSFPDTRNTASVALARAFRKDSR